tara:strand:+ start:6439 stop:7287 length:849 start_codon:yes stop_codon:yes gene_type:complete
MNKEQALSHPTKTIKKQSFVFYCITILTGVILCTTVYIITFLGADNYIQSQKALFLSINKALSAFPTFWVNMTFLGDTIVLFSLLSILLIKSPKTWAALFGSIPVAILLSRLGKWYFSIPRPAAIIEHDKFTIIGKALTGHTSLPSGHTVTIFTAITVILWALKTNKAAGPQYLLMSAVVLAALLVAISRVAVGAHWPFDLVLGALFGCCSGLSGIYISQKYNCFTSWVTLPKFKITHVIILLIFALVMIINEHYSGIFVVWLGIAMVFFTSTKLIGTMSIK